MPIEMGTPATHDREIAKSECEPRFKLPATRVEGVAYLGSEISTAAELPAFRRADRSMPARSLL